MPALKNARHERFVQGLLAGKTVTQAYKDAGYTDSRTSGSNAATLKGKKTISDRLAELQVEIASKAVQSQADVAITRSQVLAGLYAIASDEKGKAGDRRQAWMDLAKLEGWVIDRSERGDPGDFSRMSTEDLRKLVETRQGGLAPARSQH